MVSGRGLDKRGLDMVGRCKTCLYWYSDIITDESGSCSHIRVGTEQDEPGKDGLYVGAFDDHVAIITGCDFGCIHHVEDDDASTPA